jgi:CTP synthase
MESRSGEYLMNLNPMLAKWEQVVEVFRSPRQHVKIAVVGKYITLHDAYRSLYEALTHGGFPRRILVELIKIDSEQVQADNYRELLKDAQGILVPGGFGERGIEGKLLAIRHARESKIPYFGICLGMQCAVVEFARHVLGYKDANSTEFAPDTSHPVISLMEEQTAVVNKGGTMRLGAYPCKLREGSLIADCYMQPLIYERHRHRFEFNNKYRNAFESAGLRLTGLSPDESLVEAVELDRSLHPFFVGTQYHPEFKSKPLSPHPLFTRFIEKSAGL